jgi:hypothetical protein
MATTYNALGVFKSNDVTIIGTLSCVNISWHDKVKLLYTSS